MRSSHREEARRARPPGRPRRGTSPRAHRPRRHRHERSVRSPAENLEVTIRRPRRAASTDRDRRSSSSATSRSSASEDIRGLDERTRQPRRRARVAPLARKTAGKPQARASSSAFEHGSFRLGGEVDVVTPASASAHLGNRDRAATSDVPERLLRAAQERQLVAARGRGSRRATRARRRPCSGCPTSSSRSPRAAPLGDRLAFRSADGRRSDRPC